MWHVIWHEKPITGPYHNSSRLMILFITQPLDSCQKCTLRMIHKGNKYVEFSAHFAIFLFNKSGLKNIIPGWPVSFVCWYSETKKIQEKLTLLSPLSDKIWTMTSQLVKNHLKLDLLVISSLLIKPFQIFHQSPHRTFFKISFHLRWLSLQTFLFPSSFLDKFCFLDSKGNHRKTGSIYVKQLLYSERFTC